MIFNTSKYAVKELRGIPVYNKKKIFEAIASTKFIFVWFPQNLLLVLCALLFDKKLILGVYQANFSNNYKGRIKDFILKYFIKKAIKIIVMTNGQRIDLMERVLCSI